MASLRVEQNRIAISKTNTACGVVDAATRKYFTKCHLWYMPPSEMFEKIVSYANKYGDPKGAPYFSIDGKRSLTKSDWDAMRPKFKCLFGVTNVWTVNQLKGNERVKRGSKTVHLNQKPLSLIRRIIEMSSDTGDIVWDPFGGLFTTAVACHELNRRCYTSELTSEVYEEGVKRLEFDIAD